MPRPPDVMTASGWVATRPPNPINRPDIAARPAVIPTRYPPRTLTQRIHAPATMTKTRDDNNGNVASAPTNGTGRERTPRPAALAVKRALNEVHEPHTT